MSLFSPARDRPVDYLVTSDDKIFGLVFELRGDDTLYRDPSADTDGPKKLLIQWAINRGLGQSDVLNFLNLAKNAANKEAHKAEAQRA